jgi:hypothetical protein
MIYFILIILLLILIFGLIAWGLANYLYETLFVIAIIGVSLFGLYQYVIYQHHLSFLPNSMHVWKQVYASEESWGVGMPGDNETGLIEFELPSDISQNVEKEGVAYLNQLGNSGKCYGKWQETPITTDSDIWYKNADSQDSTTPDIDNYLYRYGFYIPIKQSIINEVNQSISVSGTYLDYCQGGGVIIVMPKAKKIIFAYSG